MTINELGGGARAKVGKKKLNGYSPGKKNSTQQPGIHQQVGQEKKTHQPVCQEKKTSSAKYGIYVLMGPIATTREVPQWNSRVHHQDRNTL